MYILSARQIKWNLCFHFYPLHNEALLLCFLEIKYPNIIHGRGELWCLWAAVKVSSYPKLDLFTTGLLSVLSTFILSSASGLPAASPSVAKPSAAPRDNSSSSGTNQPPAATKSKPSGSSKTNPPRRRAPRPPLRSPFHVVSSFFWGLLSPCCSLLEKRFGHLLQFDSHLNFCGFNSHGWQMRSNGSEIAVSTSSSESMSATVGPRRSSAARSWTSWLSSPAHIRLWRP